MTHRNSTFKLELYADINIIKMKVTEWINNLNKICQSPPPLGIHTTCTNYNNLIKKKRGNDFNTSKV